MSGSLVISLDFELMWGVRDHRTTADYGDAVLGVRQALPAMLALFKAHGIRATWATVGLLFARNRREMLEHCPELQPGYRHQALSPYAAIRSEIGEDEAADPWHYGRSLVDQVLAVEGQELATHTFSHYYCLEEGQSLSAFDADLAAAVRIMSAAGAAPRSIVFPRNQMTDAHVQACARHGITAFRGNPDSFAYRARSQEDNSPLVRGLRLLDASFPVTGRHSYRAPARIGACVDVRASRFFRPFSPRMGALNDLHVRRIVGEMTVAARAGEVYHLWWHPHNVGRHTGQQLARLDTILKAYRRLADEHGMRSQTMAECAAASQGQAAPSN
ncbi:polysaccharide deacetylase family protein [Hydrogenophaga sp. RWCD_12]|uniref:polysaccharide deacetylase family protein n=1 Tax=Hydrogenophaga sp. RWCD_12 TaxID=3391190 RepID=UPI00398506B9